MQKLIQLIMNAIIAEMLCCLGYDVPFIIKEYNLCAKRLSLTANSFYWFYFSILKNISTLTIILGTQISSWFKIT